MVRPLGLLPGSRHRAGDRPGAPRHRLHVRSALHDRRRFRPRERRQRHHLVGSGGVDRRHRRCRPIRPTPDPVTPVTSGGGVLPGPTTCAVVDNTGHAYTLRTGRWLAPQSFGAPGGPGSTVALYQAGRVGVSCPSSSQCTAVVGTSVLDWNGNTWTEEPAPWTSSPHLGTGRCHRRRLPDDHLVRAVNGTGVSIRTAADRWSPEQTIDPRGGLDSISCPTASFCLAADAGRRGDGLERLDLVRARPGHSGGHRVHRHRDHRVVSDHRSSAWS